MVKVGLLAPDGVVCRADLLAAGWTSRRVQSKVERRHWQRLYPGVYATFTGPVPPLSRASAGLLYAGAGAALSGRTALWLWGLEAACPARVEIAIPAERRAAGQPGLLITRHRELSSAVHPVATPTRLRLEQALLQVASTEMRAEEVVALVLRAVQQRRTTSDRINAALAQSGRHRWRGLIIDVTADVRQGVLSPLERRYLRDVHRRHRLPAATFNGRDTAGANAYRDVRYEEWDAVIELDGREAHPAHLIHRDRGRDNRLTLMGVPTLRFGWAETAGHPCDVAAQVAALLQLRGWPGHPVRCGPRCTVADPATHQCGTSVPDAGQDHPRS